MAEFLTFAGEQSGHDAYVTQCLSVQFYTDGEIRNSDDQRGCGLYEVTVNLDRFVNQKNIELYHRLITTANIEEPKRLMLLNLLGDELEKREQLARNQGDAQTQSR